MLCGNVPCVITLYSFFFLMMSIGPSQRAALASETTAGPRRPRGRACFCQARQRAAAGRAVAPGLLGASQGPLCDRVPPKSVSV